MYIVLVYDKDNNCEMGPLTDEKGNTKVFDNEEDFFEAPSFQALDKTRRLKYELKKVVQCQWCGELIDPTSDEGQYESDLGWLCSCCIKAISSRGEQLKFKH